MTNAKLDRNSNRNVLHNLCDNDSLCFDGAPENIPGFDEHFFSGLRGLLNFERLHNVLRAGKSDDGDSLHSDSGHPFPVNYSDRTDNADGRPVFIVSDSQEVKARSKGKDRTDTIRKEGERGSLGENRDKPEAIETGQGSGASEPEFSETFESTQSKYDFGRGTKGVTGSSNASS